MISIATSNPQGLLDSLREAIKRGKVTTWSERNGYFTHTPVQWSGKAWLQPSVYGNELRFAIVRSQGQQLTTEIYAVYHGRFLEMMLAHFDVQFSIGTATAMPAAIDRIAA